ncbi:sodium:inorganic phosphate symporter [Malassezia pachydermatis]
MAALSRYDWIFALITLCFMVSSFSNGANDVANSYATSVAARTLTMPQVGILAAITEFVGAVALGARVTSTIKSSIIDISRFKTNPATLLLAMACAEFGSAAWLLVATWIGFPVSTTQTIVGALVGVGIASDTHVQWGWKKGSVSQIAASWGIAPAIAGGFASVIFLTIKFLVLERKEHGLKWGIRLIPLYLSITGAILALFIVVEAPTADSLEEFGAGKAVGIVIGVLAGCLVVSYVFFVPYFQRRLVHDDRRLRAYHVVLGPLLLKEDPPLFWPGDPNADDVLNYYNDMPTHTETHLSPPTEHNEGASPEMQPSPLSMHSSSVQSDLKSTLEPTPSIGLPALPLEVRLNDEPVDLEKASAPKVAVSSKKEPEERFLAPNTHLPHWHPRRLWGYTKYALLQGVTRDCVTFDGTSLDAIHAKAKHYDTRIEHLWTYPQMASAIMMSIAHGSNDVSNAVGPWSAAYDVWVSGLVNSKSGTPVWMLVVAGLLLGIGFWFLGFKIIRQLGNRITQMSPTRGFSIELGAAITVLLASRLSLPVSTTQCLAGAALGVALMNFDTGAVNWRAIVWIFAGWILTLPCAGLISGLLMAMSLNTPHF